MLQTIIPPGGLPIAVEEARWHCKQDINADDAVFRRGIAGATVFAESETERALLATRFCEELNGFPGGASVGLVPIESSIFPGGNVLVLPRSPVLQVVSITYLDMAGVWQTMPAADYVVQFSRLETRITPAFGKIWPINKPQIGSVRVIFDAGYATPIKSVSGNTLTIGLWKTLAVNDSVRFSNSGGALPAPLQPYIDYYVQSVSGSQFTVSATAGGAVIPLTDAGSGQHYLGAIPDNIINWMLCRIDSLFVHRGETAVIQGQMARMPYIDRLLDPERVRML